MRIDRGYRNVNLSLSSVRERKLSRSQTPFQIINQKIRDEMSLVLWSGFSSGNDGSFSVVCRLLTPASLLIPRCRRLAPCRFIRRLYFCCFLFLCFFFLFSSRLLAFMFNREIQLGFDLHRNGLSFPCYGLVHLRSYLHQ